MTIEFPEDVLRLMAEETRNSGRILDPHFRFDLLALIEHPIPEQVQEKIRAAESFRWIERVKGQRWRFTRDGIDRLMAVEAEARRGPIERYFKKQMDKRPLMWGIVFPTLALIISIIALLR